MLTKPASFYNLLCKHAIRHEALSMTVSEVSAYLKLSQDNLITLLASTDFWQNWRACGSPKHRLLYKVRGLSFRSRDPVKSLACAMCLVVIDDVDHAKPSLSIIDPHRAARGADSRSALQWSDLKTHMCATRCRTRSVINNINKPKLGLPLAFYLTDLSQYNFLFIIIFSGILIKLIKL